jgi:putative endonuclease
MPENKEIGNRGEDLAASFLARKGYKILHRQWHHVHKELDIVAVYNQVLVFVEVKTRQMGCMEAPSESVTRKKQRFIIEAANAYIEKYDINLEARFDIVSVVYSGQSFKIEHIEDAFYPLWK